MSGGDMLQSRHEFVQQHAHCNHMMNNTFGEPRQRKVFSRHNQLSNASLVPVTSIHSNSLSNFNRLVCSRANTKIECSNLKSGVHKRDADTGGLRVNAAHNLSDSKSQKSNDTIVWHSACFLLHADLWPAFAAAPAVGECASLALASAVSSSCISSPSGYLRGRLFSLN